MNLLKTPFSGNLRHLFIFALFVLVLGCSFAVRTFVFNREEARIGESYKSFKDELPAPPTGPFMPFLVESSIMYAYSADVAYGKGIPSYDRLLPTNKTIRVCEQDTIGLEYFLGYGYKLKQKILPAKNLKPAEEQPYEDNPDFSNWARFQIRLWASSIAASIFLFLIVLRCPWPLALAGGLLHSVAPAAIARYTGQDIVRGEFCLPVIVALLVISFWYLSRPGIKKLVLLGLAAFLAISTWDMCQIFFGIWGVSEIFRILIGGRTSEKRRNIWIAILVAVLAASVLIPYHRVHRLFLSPLVLIIIPTIIVLSLQIFRRAYLRRMAMLVITLAVTAGIWWGISRISSFSDSYGHFGNLLVAKLKNMNVKPKDPLLLNFDARILWTPGMHSANMNILRQYFPFAIYCAPIVLGLSLFFSSFRKRVFSRDLPRIFFPFFMTVFYFIGFIFIVRYHDFEIIFLSMLLPLLLHSWLGNIRNHKFQFSFIWGGLLTLLILAVIALIPKNGLVISDNIYVVVWILSALFVAGGTLIVIILRKFFSRAGITLEKSAAVSFLFLFVFLEFGHTYRMVRDYSGEYLPEVAGLIRWMRLEGVDNEVVLANFNLSPLLKAYCHTAIILQPKFELGATRKDVQLYIDKIYHGTEWSFSQFCADKGARYYVFDRGNAGDMSPDSSRYCAAAIRLRKDSPVYMMNIPKERDKLKMFYEIEPPPEFKFISVKYVIFKIISAEDRKNAQEWLQDARKALDTGNIPLASRLAKAAVYADPAAPNVRIFYAQIFGKVPEIRLRGF